MNLKSIKRTSMISLSIWVLSIAFVFADVGNSFSGGSGGSGGWSDSSGGSSSGSSSGSLIVIHTGNSLLDLTITLALYGCIFGIAYLRNQNKLGHSSREQTKFDPRLEQSVLESVTGRDTNFSVRAFKGYAQEVFLQIQEAWESRDMSVVRPLETDTLFYRHQQQLQEYLDKNWINHLDGQNIRSVALADHYQENEFEYLVVRLEASVLDYTTNAAGSVIQGSKTQYQHRAYRLTFKRHLSVLTTTEHELSAKSCPNCGAPTNVGASGQCEFCGSVVTTGEHNWVLDNYEAWH